MPARASIAGLATPLAQDMRALVPDGVVVIGVSLEEASGSLLPAEEKSVRGAVARRRHEFAVGRKCARQAMELLGIEPVAIPVGAMREPIWPASVVGSITHCSSHCVVAMAHASEVACIGIDVERAQALGQPVRELIATEPERVWLTQRPDPDAATTLLFAIKEAVYKAWFALTRRSLDFDEVIVDVNPAERSFLATVAPQRARVNRTATLPGRYDVRDALILAAVTVPAASRASHQQRREREDRWRTSR